jgi:putative ABC transport system permease protein
VRNVLVRAKQQLKEDELQELRKKSLGVSPRDAQAIQEGVPGVDLVAPRVEVEAYKIMGNGASAKATVHGVSHEQARLSHLAVQSGRFIDARDEARHEQVAVIGSGVAGRLFGFEPAIGKTLKINDVWLTVIGVLAPRQGGRSFEGVQLGNTDEEIYIPVTTAMRKFERDALQSPLDEIVVRVTPETSPGAASATIHNLLDRLHAGAADWELVVPEALLEQSRRTQRLFTIVMACIAGISLLVGGIGIMNIMLATVLERTREIGLRRAIGAKQIDIRRQFMIESFSISLLGGVAGIVMGLAIARIVAASAGWPTVVTMLSIVLSTGVSVTVGLVSGLYPAMRAARLDPIDALRYE